MLNKKCCMVFFTILFVFFFGQVYAHEELDSGVYFTLLDESGAVITQTARVVNIGDEYISADNGHYQVVKVEGNRAYCTFIGTETMPQVSYHEESSQWMLSEDSAISVVGKKNPTVAIYHTHSDESYVPSDGTESIEGNGGIYDVGKALADKLKSLGINVIYDENNHNPHDANAYNRSRKTAASLLRKAPDIILDVHRDAVPAEQYEGSVEGEKVTQVKLVVGNQNPNKNANLEFAKELKAVMDQKTPGLSNGIFIGKGDYNQDLAPRSMLIEVGAHTNSKEEAEKGVALFAETLPVVMGVNTQVANKPLNNNGSQGMTAILILLVIAAVGVGAYFLINKGSMQE